jgi:hypothetical protein
MAAAGSVREIHLLPHIDVSVRLKATGGSACPGAEITSQPSARSRTLLWAAWDAAIRPASDFPFHRLKGIFPAKQKIHVVRGDRYEFVWTVTR